MVRFVHLSDLHVEHPTRGNLFPGVDGAASLASTMAQIVNLDPKPDFIIAAGDLTNHGDAESYAHLRQIMGGAGVPVIYTLGNHDRRAPFFRELLRVDSWPSNTYDHDCVVAGLHVIALDTLMPGELGGGLDPHQFDWLEQALLRHSGLAKIIVLHHPPAIDDALDQEWESLRRADSARLAELLRGHRVAAICAGHLHQERVGFWHGMPVVHGCSQYVMHDPLYPAGSMRFLTGTSFALCDLWPAGLVVTYNPAPADRRQLMVLGPEDIKAYEAKGRALHKAGEQA